MMPGGDQVERDGYKAEAGRLAAGHVESGMVLGLGTGSTAAHAVRAVAERIRTGSLTDISGVPTSNATAELATSLGVPLLEPGAAPMDLAIDGADEIAPDLALTKGGGGALLREKIIAAAAARFIVIADDSKLVPALGSTFDVPLEVARFGVTITLAELESHGTPALRGGDDPFVTDNGNFVVDLAVDPIEDAAALEIVLASVPGVLATGLFVGIADEAIVVGPDGPRRITR
jgi:ribose 5-phosphate isomerase A